jgi:hypothetical protein
MQRRLAALPLLILVMLACSIPGAAPTRTPVAADTVPFPPTTTTDPLPRPVEYQVCAGERMLALLVDPDLEADIRAGLDLFENDLCTAGYAVTENRTDFATPVEIRSYLASLYDQSAASLTGAILIGDQPHAYQYLYTVYANPNIPPREEEAISFQYYADLDGIFRASEGYTSLGGYEFSYDIHEGEVDWEIWIGVLPVFNANLGQTGLAINRYFAKNHAYRSGETDLPQGFLEISEHFVSSSAGDDSSYLAGMTSGEYAWTPLSSAPDARLYFDSFDAARTVDQGYADLAAGVADIAVLDAHGSPAASGRIDLRWVRTHGLRTVLLWSNGCSVGNLDVENNFLTTALYDEGSTVLIAKGTTNDSGGMGTNANGFFGHNLATGIASGLSLGEALLGHVNVPLRYPWSQDRELHFGTAVLLGDPTLVLRP